MSQIQHGPNKQHGDKLEHYGVHTHSEAIPAGKTPAGGVNAQAQHGNSLRQPPESQSRSGKQHR